MKQIIKVKVLTEGCTPIITEDGDWIDLRAAEDLHLNCPTAEMLKKHKGVTYRMVGFQRYMLPLGVAMQLPKGFEAWVVLRSSSNKKFNIIQANHIGIIDQTFCGDNDQWHLPVIAMGEVDIKKGDRVCQFRIAPSQKATLWQKVKWLFSGKVEIELVDELGNPDREGLGHSGVR